MLILSIFCFKDAVEKLDSEGVKWCSIFIAIFVALLIIVLYIRSLWGERDSAILLLNVNSMSGRQFEEFLADLFREIGYSVEVTPYSGDQGADLVIDNGNERIAVQAKRAKRNVGNRAVQEVAAAIPYYGADGGMVVTNSGFTESAIELARANCVVLIDGVRLNDMISEVLQRYEPEVQSMARRSKNRAQFLYLSGLILSAVTFVVSTTLINSRMEIMDTYIGAIIVFSGVGAMILVLVCGLLYIDKRWDLESRYQGD